MTLIDTLLWARARMPERHFGGGYGLKDIAKDRLQVDNPVPFKSVTSHPKRKVKVKVKKTKACSCGGDKCKKKKATKKDPREHTKTEGSLTTFEVSTLKKRVQIPLTAITHERATLLPHCCGGESWPGFSERTGLVCWPCLWAALVEYAGNDALWACRAVREVLSKEGHAYGHDKPTPENLAPRPSR